MKENAKTDTGFSPRIITITLETQNELDAFGTVFNFSPVADFLESAGIDTTPIYEAVNRMGGDSSTMIRKLSAYCRGC